MVFSVKRIFPYPDGYFLLQPLGWTLSESTHIATILNFFYKIQNIFLHSTAEIEGANSDCNMHMKLLLSDIRKSSAM